MFEALVATSLLGLFVGLAHRTPEVPNHNTQYCAAASPSRPSAKGEREIKVDERVEDSRCPAGAQCIQPGEVKVTKNCTKGTVKTETQKSSLSRKVEK